MINLLDLDKEKINILLNDKPYRGAQVFEWVFGKGIKDIQEMSNLPKQLREKIAGIAEIKYPTVLERQISKDGTEKFAYLLNDGNIIESVLMTEKGHWSVCVSSQVGCAMDCKFCCTATLGFIRNLSPGEILSQILYPIHAFPERHIRNVVFMGMGEPLLNYDHVIQAIHILTDEHGPQISKRRITISTCGIIPQLNTLWRDSAAGLAVSLNAPTNDLRVAIMPITKKYPLSDLIEALKSHQLPNRKRITIEYVLIGGINDSLDDARQLIRLLHGLKVKLNLIPFNPWNGCTLKAPEKEAVLAFEERLKDSPIQVMLRKEKGTDIMAACGQLAGKKNED